MSNPALLSQEDKATCFDLLWSWFCKHGIDVDFGLTSRGSAPEFYIRSVSFSEPYEWAPAGTDAHSDDHELSQE